MSSSPAARSTRAQPSARRALIESEAASPPVTGGSADGGSQQPTAEERLHDVVGKSDRQLLLNLGITIAVMVIITVVLPLLMTLVRNF